MFLKSLKFNWLKPAETLFFFFNGKQLKPVEQSLDVAAFCSHGDRREAPRGVFFAMFDRETLTLRLFFMADFSPCVLKVSEKLQRQRQLRPSACFYVHVYSHSPNSVFETRVSDTQGNISTSASVDLMNDPFYSFWSSDVSVQTRATASREVMSLVRSEK